MGTGEALIVVAKEKVKENGDFPNNENAIKYIESLDSAEISRLMGEVMMMI